MDGRSTTPARSPSARPEPPAATAHFARWFGLTKGELLASAGQPGLVAQTGGAYLPGRFTVAGPDHDRAETEPHIETFLVERDGTCSPTGTDRRAIEAWSPAVEAMTTTVIECMTRLGVALDEPAYLTASSSTAAAVTGTAHVDDDQYRPEDGVGFVAIVASHLGPRIAVSPIAHRPAAASLPLQLDPDAVASFERGGLAHQQAAAERIVIFPQFGQLHAGPSPGTIPTGSVRTLLVLRAGTRPAT